MRVGLRVYGPGRKSGRWEQRGASGRKQGGERGVEIRGLGGHCKGSGLFFIVIGHT